MVMKAQECHRGHFTEGLTIRLDYITEYECSPYGNLHVHA